MGISHMDFLPVGWSGFSSGAGNRNGEAGLDAGWQMGLQTEGLLDPLIRSPLVWIVRLIALSNMRPASV